MKLIGGLAALAVLVSLGSPSHALGMCGLRTDFMKALEGKYQEVPRSFAITGANLVEIFVSQAGTWTIIVTTPQGKTCMIGAGDSWQDLPPNLGKET